MAPPTIELDRELKGIRAMLELIYEEQRNTRRALWVQVGGLVLFFLGLLLELAIGHPTFGWRLGF